MGDKRCIQAGVHALLRIVDGWISELQEVASLLRTASHRSCAPAFCTITEARQVVRISHTQHCVRAQRLTARTLGMARSRLREITARMKRRARRMFETKLRRLIHEGDSRLALAAKALSTLPQKWPCEAEETCAREMGGAADAVMALATAMDILGRAAEVQACALMLGRMRLELRRSWAR